MPYLSLAEQYDALEPLNALVDRFLLFENPLDASKVDTGLNEQINQIKESARRDIMIFGHYSDFYVKQHINRTQKLIIRLIELDAQLKGGIIMSEKQKCLAVAFEGLAELLKELLKFYGGLADKPKP